MNSHPKISIVIPSYRPGEMIFRCLDKIMDQTLDLSREIIVVDSSPEDIGPRIKEIYPEIRTVHIESRTLSGRARSIGAQKAWGEVVFFTDTDCEVERDWMEQLWAFHEKGYSVVGGSVVNGTPRSIVGTAEYLLEFNEMNPWAGAGEVKAHPSCNLSVHRKIFEDVGYFPDFMKGEDTIFCDRIVQHGEKIFFNPGAKIVHKNREGFLHYIKNQVALGEGSIETRRRTKRHGHFLVKYPVLVPFIPIYRTLIIGKRLIRSHVKLFAQYLLLYPLIFLGLLAYTWGFIRGPYRSGLSTESAD